MNRQEKPIEAPHDNKQRELRQQPFSKEVDEKTLLTSFKRLRRLVSAKSDQSESKGESGAS